MKRLLDSKRTAGRAYQGAATAEGAQIADREAESKGLYPGQAERKLHAYTDGHSLIVRPDGPASRQEMVFKTDGYVVTQYRTGSFPAILAIEGCL